jgi:meso-butanediol dehydrogenase/(S,S)-butanediol dehydrogenase/diacetyl reductase
MAVNAKGPFLCSKFALPHLRRTTGVIVNIASVDALWGEPELAAYCASKGAVRALTRCLALDHAGDGIRAVAICPGYVRTDLLEQFYDNQPDPEAARASLTQKHHSVAYASRTKWQAWRHGSPPTKPLSYQASRTSSTER